MDAHRPDAVASRGEQAERTHEATDGHGPAVTACSHRASDLPAPEHPRVAPAAAGRRERPGRRVARWNAIRSEPRRLEDAPRQG